MATERTFIMIKPDGVQRGLVGEIISRFEKKGFRLVAMKVMQASVEHLEKHYADLSKKGFFRGLVTYMASGPVCAMVKKPSCEQLDRLAMKSTCISHPIFKTASVQVWEGLNAVKTGRVMLGETNPAASLPGTIRGDFAIHVSTLLKTCCQAQIMMSKYIR